MDRYQVVLTGFAGERIPFVDTLRLVGRISLADAVKVHLHASNTKRTVLVAGIGHAVAQHIAAAFEAAGVAVVVEPSSLATPMMCRPEADVAYRRRGLRGGFAPLP